MCFAAHSDNGDGEYPMKIRCAHCGKKSEKPASAVNRARSAGLPLYCDRTCFGLARRKHKTKAQMAKEKAAYDTAYRAKNAAALKAKKRAYFERTYDPAKAAVQRKKRMPYHVDYCRRPEYRRWKQEYDRQYRAKEFGPFAEAYLLAVELNREIKGRMTNHEIKWENKTANKAQFRSRDAKEKERSRPRFRGRRDRHSSTVGQ
jgi:hypothetical protein